MGGDGGVVATNRKYMRGAGTANHTGDYNRYKKSTQQQTREEYESTLTTCALTGKALHFSSSSIVACSHGKLYNKEDLVEALLERKRNKGLTPNNEPSKFSRIAHIRRLKDVHPVLFSMVQNAKDQLLQLVCPITGMELCTCSTGASVVPSLSSKTESTSSSSQRLPTPLLLIRDATTTTTTTTIPNVLHKQALKAMDSTLIQKEYGPFSRTLRLAPPPDVYQQMVEDTIRQQEQEQQQKQQHEQDNKKRKKKSKQTDGSKKQKRTTSTSATSTPATTKTTPANAARVRVASAVQSNKVLSSLFTKP